MARRNEEIASAFDELADLLELRGADRFRILTYRRASDALRGIPGDVAGLAPTELVRIRGIGKSVAAKIAEFLESGSMRRLEELRGDVPKGVVEFTHLPGLGPKRAMLLHSELGVSTLEELREAARAQRVREVKGFGPKVEELILKATARGPARAERILLAKALPLAESMVEALSGLDAVERCACAGSVRRMRETIGDLDILVASARPDEVSEAIQALSEVVRAYAAGETKTSVLTTEGLQVDVRVVPPESFGAAMQYFTGSKAHNVKVREHAVRLGYKLSEYGLHTRDGDTLVAGKTEEDVYAALGMPWVPPPMREDRGEVEAALAGELPTPVALEDMRGDLQSHSTYSDGKASIRTMAVAAADLGYQYYAITDHGRWLRMKSLSLQDIEHQREEVRGLNDELGGRITVLHGVELNIDREGAVDYPDDVLAGFDLCVASIHHHFNLTSKQQTKRFLRAIANPHVHVIGHPSARRLDRRGGIDFDLAAVAKAAAAHGVALEINAHPWRLDLRDEHVRWARDHGVRFAISTDAHSPAELGFMRFGIGTAQRGWATAAEIINTWPLDRLRAFLRKEVP